MIEIKTWLLITLIVIISLTLIYLAFRLSKLKTNSIGNFFKLMVSTGDEVSSKRVIALVAFILMAVSYSYGIITDTKIPEYMWEGFLFIVLAAFFGNVVEKFKRKGGGDGGMY
jgi:VIT1/CCC1 family predicted Fe2+/Mn2+ transporter